MQAKLQMQLQDFEEARKALFDAQTVLTDKIRKKRERFLLKVPLLSLIYQKKGASVFQLVVQHTRMVKAHFGDTVISSQEDRTFNIILKGSVMLFTRTKKGQQPKLHKKLMIGDHFGETLQFGRAPLESVRCATLCYLLQMDMKFFYHVFSGHFECSQFIDRVNCLREIWVFSKLKNELLEKILLTSENSKHVRGSLLFRQGGLSSYLFVILQGEVTLTTSKKGKNVPLSILSKFQVYGIEEIQQQRSYACSGLCTSDYVEILKVDKETVAQVFDKDILPETFSSRKKLISDLKEKHGDSKRLMTRSSFSTHQTGERRLSTLDHRRLQTQTSESYEPLNKFQMLNALFKPQIQLKHSNIRGIRQEHIKDSQKQTLYSTNRISSYVNKDCTCDKEIILSYIERKEKRYQKAINKEMQFQRKRIVIVPQLRVDRSPAVKNHKRKLKNSRKLHNLSLQQIC